VRDARLRRRYGHLIAAAALVLVHGVSIATVRGIVRLAALPAVAWLAQLAFRVVYYNDWVPNTAYAKVTMSKAYILAGLALGGEYGGAAP
jgi:hypothetical protein